MKIDIISIFDNSYFAPLDDSILKRAQNNEIITIGYHNLREYTTDIHRTVDDRPYGGGPGMVFKPEPLYKAIEAIKQDNSTLIYPSPAGELLSQQLISELVTLDHLVFICGHYEGIDARIKHLFNIREISIGDYVLTSGSLASIVIIDAVVRQIPGVVGCEESVPNDSFFSTLLDHPHYTRPAEFMGIKVPEVLLSGNHSEIEQWRLQEAERITKKNRPDLWKKYKKEIHYTHKHKKGENT